MNTYIHDLAISAVPYDSMLVAELSGQLAPRLRTVPFWAGRGETALSGGSSALLADYSRLALVLHQRLWGHDATTESDDGALRERLRQRPDSVCVVTLDDEPLPDWLAPVARCDLSAVGVDGVASFALDVISATGGPARQAPAARAPEPEPQPRWHEGPPAFLTQPRAASALRRELDALGAELQERSRLEAVRGIGRSFEFNSLPQRLVARMGDIAISFSWVAGRMGTVADGRLLVIQWDGLAPRDKGVNALRSATSVREGIYHAEGRDAEHWHWRADAANGRAWSSANLAAEWFAGATMEAAPR